MSVPSAPSRKPWPMRWIVLTILVVIVPYTFVNLKFRKPNKAFEPYADMMNQANVNRLLDAGYRRVTLPAATPSPDFPAPGDTAAALAPASGGLPSELGETLVQAPRLPVSYRDVTAPAQLAIGESATLRFTVALDTDRERIGGADLFLRDQTVVIVPTFVGTASSTSAAREQIVQITLPAALLAPGTHVFTLAGGRDSVNWSILVR